MSENLVKLYTTEFSTVLQIKLQQRQSKLRGRVMEGSHTGKMASPVQYMGPVQMKTPTGRFAPKSFQNADFTRRWVFPVDKDADQLFDNFDALKTIIDPKSQASDVAAAAVSREWDDRLIAAAFGTAQTGVDAGGLSSETWASISTLYTVQSTFGSSAASGLTVQKMIEAKRIFRKAQVDLETEPLTWVTNSQGESDLLNQAQVVSTDFNNQAVLVNGVVTRFMGMDIVYSERLSSDGATRKNIVFCKSGLYLGVWLDVQTQIFQMPTLSGNPWDVSTVMSSGATRLEPGRLLEVDCADASAAADVTP